MRLLFTESHIEMSLQPFRSSVTIRILNVFTTITFKSATGKVSQMGNGCLKIQQVVEEFSIAIQEMQNLRVVDSPGIIETRRRPMRKFIRDTGFTIVHCPSLNYARKCSRVYSCCTPLLFSAFFIRYASIITFTIVIIKSLKVMLYVLVIQIS